MAGNRRREIIEASYQVLGNEGLEGLHARSVAAKLGINHAAVHYYFPKRSDLLLAVTDHMVNLFAEHRNQFYGNVRDRIDAHFEQAKTFAADSTFSRAWASLLIYSVSDQAVRAELVRHFREWAFTAGMDVRPFGDSTSAFLNSELLVCTLLGIIVANQMMGSELDSTRLYREIKETLYE